MAKRNRRVTHQLPVAKPDLEKIYKLTLPEDVQRANPNMVGFTYRNVTMMVRIQGGMAALSFSHPNRCPYIEEMRKMIDRIIPNHNFFIPVNLHTLESHMVTAIELPGEVKKGDSKDDGEQPAEQSAETEVS